MHIVIKYFYIHSTDKIFHLPIENVAQASYIQTVYTYMMNLPFIGICIFLQCLLIVRTWRIVIKCIFCKLSLCKKFEIFNANWLGTHLLMFFWNALITEGSIRNIYLCSRALRDAGQRASCKNWEVVNFVTKLKAKISLSLYHQSSETVSIKSVEKIVGNSIIEGSRLILTFIATAL